MNRLPKHSDGVIIAGVLEAVLIKGRLNLVLLWTVINGLVRNCVEGVLEADVQFVRTRTNQVGLLQSLLGVDQWELSSW